MLECYLDDSGTHGNSRVVSWGGVAGDKKFFEQLETAWKAQLANPCKDRPPIKAFHSHDLARSFPNSEFDGYNLAERDRTRYNFRQIIIDCGLSIVSYGISIADWKKVSSETRFKNLGGIFSSAESFIFAYIVKEICRGAKEHGEPISFQFDSGRFSYELASHIQPALKEAGISNQYVSYGFSLVKATMGLQAADLVAHETNQYLNKYIDDPNAETNIHLRRLIEGVNKDSNEDVQGSYSYHGWLEEAGIRAAFEGALTADGPFISGDSSSQGT